MPLKLRKKRVGLKVFERVEERHKAGEALDKDLFAEVGKEFGVGGTVAAELYYGTREALTESLAMWDESFREDHK